MSFVDNDPPKHLDVGSLTDPDKMSIYGRKRSLLNGCRKRYVYFSLEEIRILIIKEGISMPSTFRSLSKKEYEKAMEMKERANKYLEEEKQNTNGI